MMMVVAMPMVVPMVMVVIMPMVVIVGMAVIAVPQPLQRARRLGLPVEQGLQRRPHHLVARR